MATPNLQDVINGATPLELLLSDTHPRLHLNAARLEALRANKDKEPWASMLARVRGMADAGTKQIANRQLEGRGGAGSKLSSVALTYLVSGEQVYLDTARDIMLATCEYEGYDGGGSFGGCWLYALGLAYDWLYHDLDNQTLERTRAYIVRRGRERYEKLALYQTIDGSWYACNHIPNYLYDLAAGGMAIYGDEPNMAPWLRFVMEKTRQMIQALGPDGASQEGIGYGGFYTEYFVKALDIINDLLGMDFFAQSPWLSNTWAFHLYSSLPRGDWSAVHSTMTFGDSARFQWHGPDSYLLRLGSYHGNGHAQWLGQQFFESGLSGPEGWYLNPVWYNPEVEATPPTDLPTLRHFEDHDVVMMRSGWDGRESVLGFRSGPFSGHHIMRHYNGDTGGGHMHPDAGSLLLFAHGDWLITDGGYSRKQTAYRNTILVNGIGQTGEGSEWFEGVELRRKPRAPRIVRVERGDGYDIVSAELTPAYEPEAGAKSMLRHLVYLRPDCWVILDDLATDAPSTFDMYFHSDFPYERVDNQTYRTAGKSGALTVTSLSDVGVEQHIEKQMVLGISTHVDHEMDLLRITNPQPASRQRFVTVLEAHDAGGAPVARASLETTANNGVAVLVEYGEAKYRIELAGDSGEPLAVTVA